MKKRSLAHSLSGEIDGSLKKAMTYPVDKLRKTFSYDPLTGELRWLIWHQTTPVGSLAGSFSKSGYRCIQLDGRKYRAARIAWAIYYGWWPEGFLDHINRNRSDDRIANLRDASRSQNEMNRPAVRGLKGASFAADSGRWKSRIIKEGKRYYLGTFDTEEEAHEAYCEAVVSVHGVFARTK